MKKWSRVSAVALIAISCTHLSYAEMAIADSNPQVSPSSDPSRNPMEQYRSDREKYFNDLRARNELIRTINYNFKVACDSATLAFKNAMAVARTPDQKNLAIANRKSAISAAIALRDSAINALGPEPIPPIEPAKPMKVGKGKNR